MSGHPDLTGAKWRTSSRTSQGSECVEVASAERMIAVRDSKDPDGPNLAFAARDWAKFMTATKSGTFDPR